MAKKSSGKAYEKAVRTFRKTATKKQKAEYDAIAAAGGGNQLYGAWKDKHKGCLVEAPSKEAAKERVMREKKWTPTKINHLGPA